MIIAVVGMTWPWWLTERPRRRQLQWRGGAKTESMVGAEVGPTAVAEVGPNEVAERVRVGGAGAGPVLAQGGRVGAAKMAWWCDRWPGWCQLWPRWWLSRCLGEVTKLDDAVTGLL